jgi:DNA-binding PadR family transcriptional regulator
MKNDLITDKWMHNQKKVQILDAFQFPKTPAQVEKQLGIKKLKLNPFLKQGLITLLNPDSTKGRLYISTSTANQCLQTQHSEDTTRIDWNSVGWVLASPKQRTVILKFLSTERKTSDEVLEKALKENSSITRISAKGILNELVSNGLVETELKPELKKIYRGYPIYRKKLRRYYWLNGIGKKIQEDVQKVVTSFGKNQVQ